MEKILMLLVSFLTIVSVSACSNDNKMPEPDNDNEVNEGTGSAYFGGKKVLVAYFSWGGTTQRMAQQIQDITGADMFRIEPVKPYPTEYTPCTEVAREEKDNNARPAIISRGWLMRYMSAEASKAKRSTRLLFV